MKRENTYKIKAANWKMKVLAKAKVYLPLLCIFLMTSCEDEFLDIKPDKALLVPESIEDHQELLNNISMLNVDPILNFIISDNYVVFDRYYNFMATPTERNGYIWAEDVYEGQAVAEWTNLYRQIFYANVVLEGLENTDYSPQTEDRWNMALGSALFFRAYGHFNLLRIFAPLYDPGDSEQLGIPLKLNSSISNTPPRSSLVECYESIFEDLAMASELLPEQSSSINQPSKITVDGLLARIHLVRREYDMAGEFAQRVLQRKSDLVDFNDLNVHASMPFNNHFAESFFYSLGVSYSLLNLASLSTELWESYDDNDLRKYAFFLNRGGGFVTLKATYSGNRNFYSGMATDEFYLIYAESLARANDVQGAMNLINTLLEKRYATGTFTPISAANADEALDIVLQERRKELVYRGWRGDDLRRLNKESRYAKTLMRDLNGESYTLPPNDPRYVWPIPDIEVRQAGLVQNER